MKYSGFPVCLLVLSAAMTCGSSFAQVRKCVGPDGKVTYSDYVCKSTAMKESSVKLNENTLDGSTMRDEVRKNKDNEAADSAVRSGACKFDYYKYGDETGASLAAEAKRECLANIVKKRNGEQTSDDAYNRWKDHKAASKRSVCSTTGNIVGGVAGSASLYRGSTVCR